MRSFGEAARQYCGLAAALLGWRPNEFWAATPTELATCLLPPSAGVDGPDRALIEALRQRFPD